MTVLKNILNYKSLFYCSLRLILSFGLQKDSDQWSWVTICLHFEENATKTEHINGTCLSFILFHTICNLRSKKTWSSTSDKKIVFNISFSGKSKVNDDAFFFWRIWFFSDHDIFKFKVSMYDIFIFHFLKSYDHLSHKLFLLTN